MCSIRAAVFVAVLTVMCEVCMADEIIEVRVTGNPAKLVESVSLRVSRYGVGFRGDEHTGVIDGKGFRLTYTFIGDLCNIRVHKKPFYVPMAAVRSEIRGVFER